MEEKNMKWRGETVVDPCCSQLPNFTAIGWYLERISAEKSLFPGYAFTRSIDRGKISAKTYSTGNIIYSFVDYSLLNLPVTPAVLYRQPTILCQRSFSDSPMVLNYDPFATSISADLCIASRNQLLFCLPSPFTNLWQNSMSLLFWNDLKWSWAMST